MCLFVELKFICANARAVKIRRRSSRARSETLRTNLRVLISRKREAMNAILRSARMPTATCQAATSIGWSARSMSAVQTCSAFKVSTTGIAPSKSTKTASVGRSPCTTADPLAARTHALCMSANPIATATIVFATAVCLLANRTEIRLLR